ncbi:MAG: dockerin type I repeat-containing protein [Clostridia bacterium]|nr:dockerin type I repeat-containing protein [Clostridia bacterium]
MKNSTRRVSMLLAVMMVLSLFAAFPMMVGAADTNYAAGLTATVTKNNADYTPSTGAIADLTNGTYAASDAEASRYLGSGATFTFVYNLGSVKTDVASVLVSVFYNASSGGSCGGFVGATVEVSTDGTNYTAVYTNTTGYTLADTAAGTKNFAFNFTATSAQYVKISVLSEKYITSMGEIEIRNYASTGDAADITVQAPATLIEGNYAYGGTYTTVKIAADGTESAASYRSAAQTDSGTQLTDGYEGDGRADGTAYKTVSPSGTGASYGITLTLPEAKSDVNYITLYNVPIEGTSFCYPTSVSIKTSSDGITYNDVTFTEVMTLNAEETSYEISYVFNSAVSAQYIQFKWTQVKYMIGLDEFWVGGTATVPEIPESSSEEESSITADPTVITSPTATNYAPNGYYQYGANTSAYPWTSSTNGDPNFTEAGKYGKGELNDGAYAADNVNNDQAWVAILGSEVYNTINQVELIYDLAAVYGDIDQIVINYYRHAGEGDDGFSAEYAKVNGIKVSFGDYNGTYGAETTVYAGTVTETVNSYGIYKNQYAVGDLTGNVRFVKIVIPKTVYRLVIDEIEIIGASGYNIKGEEPVEPDPTTSESDPSSSEDPANPYPYFEPSFELELSAQIGNFDPDGPDYSEFTEKEYLAVDITLVDHDDTKYPYGLTSFEGFLYFDEDNLVPAFVTSDHLNGNTTNPKPGPIYSWPTYTETVTVPGYGTVEVVKTAASGACWAYAYVLEDGTLVGKDGIPSTDTDALNKQYSIGLGWTDITFMTENYTAAEGVYVKDNIVFRYYFSAKDGSFDAGESFYFDVDDSQKSDWIGDAQLTGASYAGPNVMPSYVTEVGKSTPITFTVPAETVYYTVTFVDKDGNVLSEETVEAGTAATAPAAPAVEGFDFTGWDKDFTAVSEDMTVTAQYEQIMVTVTFVAGANGSLTGTTSVTVAYGTDLSTVTFPEAVAADGYEFDAWSATSGAIKVDTTVTASFKEIPVAVDHFTFAEGADSANVVVSTDGNTIYFKAGGLTSAALSALFADDSITVAKATGVAVSGTTLAGTACVITSTIGSSVATRTIVVLGDINGDGKVNASDYAQVLNCAKTKVTLTGAKRLAANVAAPTTDVINASDYGMVKNFAAGKLVKFTTAVK